MGGQWSREQTSLYFLRGPLDGYTELTDTPLEQMPEVLGILISPGIVDMLTTQRPETEIPATSLAFYRQNDRRDGTYAFVGSTSPEVIEQEGLGVPPTLL